MPSEVIQLLGYLGLRNALARTAREINTRTDSRMRIVAEEILTEAKELAPVDTGYMRSTGFVRRPKLNILEIGFAASYAIFVHEIPASHKAPTQWKFLEQPAKRRLSGVADRVDLWDDLLDGMGFQTL